MLSYETCLSSVLCNYILPHKKEFKVMQEETNIEMAACTVVMAVLSDSTVLTMSYVGLFNINKLLCL